MLKPFSLCLIKPGVKLSDASLMPPKMLQPMSLQLQLRKQKSQLLNTVLKSG
jgi:hypothetical protein